jgi:DNA-binding IclR family transcriptional regulator
MDEQTMAALAGVLDALRQMEVERPDKPCSLARLSKQAQRPMSVLRRQLTMLEEAGLVTLALEEGGVTGTVQLTAPGRELANQLRA